MPQNKLPNDGRFAAQKPKRYRTFLLFGPQNQLRREKTQSKDFLTYDSSPKQVLKSLSFAYKRSLSLQLISQEGGGVAIPPLVIWIYIIN